MRAFLPIVLPLACREAPLTELVVVVASDMDVPAVLDEFHVRVDGGDGLALDAGFSLAEGGALLPASFGIAPRAGDVGVRVTVEVDARSAGETLFTTRAVTGFVEGKVLRLDMFLAGRCVDETCEADETCRPEGCVDPDVDPRDLPPFEEGCDEDTDGHAAERCGGADCDDSDEQVHPGAPEATLWRIGEVDSTISGAWHTSVAPAPSGLVFVVHRRGGSSADELVVTEIDRDGAVDRASAWSMSQGGAWPDAKVDADSVLHVAFRDIGEGLAHLVGEDIEPVDAGAGTWDLSLAIDPAGRVHTTYPSPGDQLRYATDASGNWTPMTLDAGGESGLHSDVAVSADGVVHVAFMRRDGLFHASDAGGGFVTDLVTESGGPAAVSTVIDADGTPHVAYLVTAPGPVSRAWKEGERWATEVVHDRNASWMDLAIGPTDDLHVVLVETDGGAPIYAQRRGGGWTTEAIDEAGDASYARIAIAADGTAHVAWVQSGSAVRHGARIPAPDGVDSDCDGSD